LITLLLFVQLVSAQTTGVKATVKSITLNKQLSDLIRQKRSSNGFTLITPTELASLDLTNAAVDDPCNTAAPIYFAQQLTGQLANTDCRLDDNSYADIYMFDGLAGEQATVNMGSGTIDSYLFLGNLAGTWILQDDDSGGATNARISATLPESGAYLIVANSAFPNQFGTYSLSLTGGPSCSFTFDPPSADVPAGGGAFSFNITTGPRCYWAAGPIEFYVTSSSSGVGSGTATYNVAPNNINQLRQTLIFIRNTSFNIRQAGKLCSYSLGPSPVINIGPDQLNSSFSVTAEQGCFWSAQAVGYFLSASGSSNGSGTVNFSAFNNNAMDRSGTIRVFDPVSSQTFTVNQTGRNCTYSVSPTQLNPPASGASGIYTINTQPGCTWVLNRNQLWINVQTGLGSGPASLPYTIAPQIERSTRSGVIQFSYNFGETSGNISTYIDQAARVGATLADYDGDGKTDISIFRPSVAEWWYSRSTNGQVRAAQFGAVGDIPTPGDFTGDGKTDIAFWRPSDGFWYVLRSEDGSFFSFPFGTAGDIPMPADFDADGKTDPAIFRPSTGTWFIPQSGGGGTMIGVFGQAGDQPVAADYDGDGKADIAIIRRNAGNMEWWIQRSTAGFFVAIFGVTTDKAVPGDYTGDGKTDVAVWRPSNGTWFVLRSEDSSFFSFPFGSNGDIPAPGDYDGDGKTDATVFRPSVATWFVNRSGGSGTLIAGFGIATDTPVPSVFVR